MDDEEGAIGESDQLTTADGEDPTIATKLHG